MDEIPAAQSGVVSRAVRREVQDEVRTVLDDLEEQDREIIILRGIEQQSNATVGLLLEISAEAVSKRYHRALDKLRARLPGSVFEEFDAA